MEPHLYWGMKEGLDLWEAFVQILWYILPATETFVFYIQFLQNSIQYTTNNFPNTTERSSIPSTGWLFLPNPIAAQLWNSPSLLSKTYSWPLPQEQIFWNSNEDENLWSLKVMPVQRQFTFYPRTQYDWINNGGHTYKNTTHQNITMHYLEFIFLNCTAVMPPTLPLTFRCLSKFQFPFMWWWKIDLLMSSCIVHLAFCLLKKLLEF